VPVTVAVTGPPHGLPIGAVTTRWPLPGRPLVLMSRYVPYRVQVKRPSTAPLNVPSAVPMAGQVDAGSLTVNDATNGAPVPSRMKLPVPPESPQPKQLMCTVPVNAPAPVADAGVAGTAPSAATRPAATRVRESQGMGSSASRQGLTRVTSVRRSVAARAPYANLGKRRTAARPVGTIGRGGVANGEPDMPATNTTLDLSDAGLKRIAAYEGWRADLYEDVAHHATIGYGHLVHLGPITAADRSGPFGKGISQQQGLDLLRSDVKRMVDAVRQRVSVPLNQNQFDALVSFTFNVGAGAFGGSTLLKRLNAADYAGAAGEFGKWTKSGGKVFAGLVRRRTEEAALFRGGAAPSPGPAPKPAPKPAGKPAGGGWFSRTLRNGSRGADVKELQRRLGVGADGIFGRDTEAAVRTFQQRKGLGVDGVVGPRTAAAL
jgi:lysozyme